MGPVTRVRRPVTPTRAGTRRLRAAGYTVVRFTDAEVKYQPADVLTRLRTQAPHARTR